MMTTEEFETIAQEEFDALPEALKRRIENVSIVVEPAASPEQLRKVGARHPLGLLGLYEGIPLTRRDSGYGNTVPDKITLFKQAIEGASRHTQDIRTMIREVLIHEIAHYYGMGEEEIRSAGY